MVRRRLTAADRGRVLGWLDEGVSQRGAARRLGVSHSVIQRILERVQTTGQVEDRRRSGRPRATTKRQDRYVVVTALRERRVTANSPRGQLREATGVAVSDQTIRNRLREARMASRRPAVRIPLLRRHRVARMGWSRRHRRWTMEQWSRILFTDESRFSLSSNDGRVRVWRRSGERFTDATITQHERYGGGSVLMWGGISLNSRTPLYHIEGNLSAQRYRDEILQPIVLPTLQEMGPAVLYQDDNARPHRARIVNEFMQRHYIERLPWPANSPDLAPIKHIWDELGRAVMNNHPPPRNRQQLIQFLRTEWYALPQEKIRTVIRSMRRRCEACYTARGGHTRY